MNLLPLGGCDVFDRFYVELGQGFGGSCANYPVLAIYSEVLDMAQAAVTAIDNYDSNPVVRAEVQTYFGITESNIALLAEARRECRSHFYVNPPPIGRLFF